MIKELFLALTLGALLGFGITGTYLAVKKKPVSPPPVAVLETTPTPVQTNISITPTVPVNTNDNQLTVDSPENESVVTSSQVTVKGSASPLSTIIITTATQTAYITADNGGLFSHNLTLDSGVNLIQIDAVDSTDNLSTTQLLVTYSTAKF